MELMNEAVCDRLHVRPLQRQVRGASPIDVNAVCFLVDSDAISLRRFFSRRLACQRGEAAAFMKSLHPLFRYTRALTIELIMGRKLQKYVD